MGRDPGEVEEMRLMAMGPQMRRKKGSISARRTTSISLPPQAAGRGIAIPAAQL